MSNESLSPLAGPRTRRRPLLALVAPAVALLAPAGAAHAVVRIEEIHPSHGTLDHRTGQVAPAPEALAEAAAIGGTARWNRFGTIHELFKPGGFLAADLAGEPVEAARSWLRQHRSLVALAEADVDALELVRDEPLAGSTARVLLFGQVAGGLRVLHEGRIKMGLVDGKLFWLASSSIGSPGELAAPVLSAADAWLAAAADLGLAAGPGDILGITPDGDWQALEVAGLAYPQRARLVALGMPGAGAVPAWETLTIDLADGALTGVSHFVDAQSGAVVVRRDRVAQRAAGGGGGALPAAAPGLPRQPAGPGEPARADVFVGAYPPGQVGQCGPCHGPYTAAPGEAWERIEFVVQHLTGGDVTVRVYRDEPACDGVPILEQDLLTSPEVATVSPVLAGDYTVEVCPFDTLTNRISGDYTGSVTFLASLGPNENPKWRYFPAYPAIDGASADSRLLGCWFATDPGGAPLPECDLELVGGSSHGVTWDNLPTTGTSSQTTSGNAGRASEAWHVPLSGGEAYQPFVVSADPADHRVFDFPWANQWFESACDPAALTHTGGLLPDNDIDAAITNLFAIHNQVHDFAYHLGYRERQGAAQLDNFGQTSPAAENDPELGNAQAGALTGGAPSYQGRDNANQLPTPDGVPPLTNMYLWQTIGGAISVPCADGDFDAGVIAHEYGHLIQHRMVDPQNGLSGDLGRAMGESWSDLTAIELLNAYGRVPVAGENPFAIGAYLTDPQTGIRNYAMNASPLNLSDVGYDFTCQDDLADGTCLNLTQEHSDGEIWSAVNFDHRQALAAKYDADFPAADATLQRRCADGDLPADRCPGNRRWTQLVHDSFLLMPGSPSMLDARDAMLAADLARAADPALDWPSNEAELWDGFARRGFGEAAAARDGDDAEPVADFASPLGANAAVTFRLVSAETAAPLVGEVYVGRYEARTTPVADTDPASARGDGHRFVAGRYELVARANGYGHLRFELDLAAGQTATAVVHMPANWASAAQGASAGGALGTRHASLIDDTEATSAPSTASACWPATRP